MQGRNVLRPAVGTKVGDTLVDEVGPTLVQSIRHIFGDEVPTTDTRDNHHVVVLDVVVVHWFLFLCCFLLVSPTSKGD